MAKNITKGKIGNALTSTANDHVVVVANDIYDENINKYQSQINDELEQQVIYDVSIHNDGAVFESLQSLLSDPNLDILIPTSVRHGGMSIRFVQGSDNKYVQYRLMVQNFTTDVTQWQGVDDVPTAGSDNLVKSGGVYKLESVITGVLVDKTFNEINVNSRVTAFIELSGVGSYIISISNIILPANVKYRVTLTNAINAYSSATVRNLKSATSLTDDIEITTTISEQDILNGAKYIAVICETADAQASFYVKVTTKSIIGDIKDVSESCKENSKAIDNIQLLLGEKIPYKFTIAHDNAYCKTYTGVYGNYDGCIITDVLSIKKGCTVYVKTAIYGASVISTDEGEDSYKPILLAVSTAPVEPITYKYTAIDDISVAFCGYKNDLEISILNENGIEQRLQILGKDIDVIKDSNSNGQPYLLRHNGIIPSYYFEVPEVITDLSDEYLDGKIKEINNTENCLVFITDTHWTINKKKSPALIKYIIDKAKINNILFGGDLIGINLTVPETMLNARIYMNDWLSAFSKSMLFGIGDHDLNTGSIAWNQKMSYQNAKKIYLSALESIVTFDTTMINKVPLDNEVIEWGKSSDEEVAYLGGVNEFESWLHFHYSFDDNEKRIRYIVLNTGGPHTYYVNIKLKVGDSGYENNDLYMQMDFIYQQLMTLPDDYAVVVLGHRLIHYNHDFQVYGVMLDVAKLLSAFKTKSSVTINCPLTRIPNWYANGEHTYDFSNAPTVSKIFALCGDTHHDSSCITQTKNGVYVSESYVDGMSISNDAILFINTHCDDFEGNDSATGGNESKAPMVANTVTEQSFDIVSWNSSHVYCTRIGAGDNRTFNY